MLFSNRCPLLAWLFSPCPSNVQYKTGHNQKQTRRTQRLGCGTATPEGKLTLHLHVVLLQLPFLSLVLQPLPAQRPVQE